MHVRKDALVKDLDAIYDISKTMMNYSESLARDSISPGEGTIFFESILTLSQDVPSTRASLEEKNVQLSRQIDALTPRETQKQGQTNREITVVIMARKAVDIELKLTYRMLSLVFGLLKKAECLFLRLTVLPSCRKCDMVCSVRVIRNH